jgi:hypothetical protein
MAQKFAANQPVKADLTQDEIALLPNEVAERYVPGFGVVRTGTPQAVENFRTELATRMSAKENVGELRKIMDMPMKSVSIEQRARAATIAGMLKGQLRPEIVGPGAVTDREQEMLDNIIADPTAIFSIDTKTKARLDELMAIMDRTTANQAKVLGLTTQKERLDLRPAK